MPSKQVVIENPVINSPFDEPGRHYKFTEEGITNEIVTKRRTSSYFIPIAKPKSKGKKGQQQQVNIFADTEWTEDRLQENKFINQIRDRVSIWRRGGYLGVSRITARLLEYWQREGRARRLFFCQIEALETVIYITEASKKYGDAWIESRIIDENNGSNPGLFRMACKMATGSGKTVVMAMLIAWHALNKAANPQARAFSDAFLIIAPGITIKDRLRVLFPSDPQNYYSKMDLVPPDLLSDLGRAKIIITNFHQFRQREKGQAKPITKAILERGKESAFKETPAQTVKRVCRELGTKQNIIVLNDEAHHCYRRKPDGESPKLTGDERKEAEKRAEEARIWISGIEAAKEKIGIRAIYDLSATPFFLRGSGYPEGTLFPWVVSDFSLIDAIESGIVKVPRVPVSDDSMTGESPTYRDLWVRIRDDLPKKGKGTEDLSADEPVLPAVLESAIQSLYNNYRKYYDIWESGPNAKAKGQPPPVFIVVCNNTNVSNLVYRYIAGWEKKLPPNAEGIETVLVPGNLPAFNNVREDGKWKRQPNTILIDSEQLESGEAMSDDFKKIAALEIEEFKAEYRLRFPGMDPEKLTDEDLLREVLNTVGKAGKLGENVKCVVSVSMLTEGWDANTVTHILGVRAFGTQLLCEQVVGRGLRRMSYGPETRSLSINGENVTFTAFPVEYAEVYGVPFSFIPCAGSTQGPKPGPDITRVRALEDRIEREITFPRVTGYRFDMPGETLEYVFDEKSKFPLSTRDVPTITESAPIIGESTIHDLKQLETRRLQEVAFLLAKRTLPRFSDDDGNLKPWLFPQLLSITHKWLNECLVREDNVFPQMLLLVELAERACDKIYHSIVGAVAGQKVLKPILRPYDVLGSTRYVAFDTIKPVYATKADKCHLNYVVADTNSWEQKTAQALEEMDEVKAYAKNQNLGFTIPYVIAGKEKNYTPDFLARVEDGHGEEDLLNLILEVSGEDRQDKEIKTLTASRQWVPAINNHGGFGRWAFIEIKNPWNAKTEIRAFLSGKAP